MSNPTPPPSGRYYGDPTKPGYPTPDQIAEWERVADCAEAGHPAFTAADTDPRRPLEQCPGCGSFLRTITTEPDYETISENRKIARHGWDD